MRIREVGEVRMLQVRKMKESEERGRRSEEQY